MSQPAMKAVPGLRLRPFAGDADFPAMAAVANANFAADGRTIVRRVAEMQRDYASFRRCDPRRDVVLAEVGGELAGYARSGAPWRGRGLARALVVRALRALRDAGMTESELGVDSDNAFGARRIYEACGFRVVRRNAVYRKPLVPAAAVD